MSRVSSLIGKQFELWTVLAFARMSPHGKSMYLCRCACGVEREVVGASLVSGLSTSCDCARPRHGYRAGKLRGHSAEYEAWADFKSRCNNPKTKCYRNYGGRGITVCAGWSNSFDSFIADMGQKPSTRLEIDRIDNNGGYWCGHCDECVSLGRKANCRWVTRSENNKNKRYSGKKKTQC